MHFFYIFKARFANGLKKLFTKVLLWLIAKFISYCLVISKALSEESKSFLEPDSFRNSASPNQSYSDFKKKGKFTDSTQEDNLLKEKYYLICGSGDVIIEYKKASSLIKDNTVLIERIFELCFFNAPYEEKLFLSLLQRLSQVCSIAPASKFLHDSDGGGLFRHSLLVAVKALEIYKEKQIHQDSDELKEQLFIIFISFLHDLGKLFTDYKISTAGKKYIYNPDNFSLTLDEFCVIHKASRLRFSFVKKRDKDHHRALDKALVLLSTSVNELCDYIFCERKYKDEILAFIEGNQSSIFFKILKKADIFACHCSLKEHNSMFESGQFLKSLFLSKQIDCNLRGFYKTGYGYLVEKGSPAYSSLIDTYDRYTYIKRFSKLDVKAIERISDSSATGIFNIGNMRDLFKDGKFESNILDEHYLILDNAGFDREMFFRELCDSSFYIQGAYKRSCIWRAVSSGTKGCIRFVYGFCINLDMDSSYGDADDLGHEFYENLNIKNSADLNEYRILKEFTDKEVDGIFNDNKNILREYKDLKNISSFAVSVRKVSEDNFEYRIIKSDDNPIGYYDFSEQRDKETRLRSKIKEKNKKNEFSRISKVVNDTAADSECLFEDSIYTDSLW